LNKKEDAMDDDKLIKNIYQKYCDHYTNNSGCIKNLDDDRFKELIEHKKNISGEMSDKFKYSFIDRGNKELKLQILKMMLSDMALYYAYVYADQNMLNIIMNLTKRIKIFEINK
jgi:hypothetical protein